MADDRKHIHPMALRALEKGSDIHPPYLSWCAAGGPFLTPRASAVLAAVEEAMGQCERLVVDKGNCDLCPYDTPCNLKTIRDAWKQTGEADDA